MIPVAPAPEPDDFDARVRKKGLNAIAELVGESPPKSRRGPRRKKIADSREGIPSEAFPPYWRDVLPEMLESYHRICAYLALYIEHATGSPSVDHVVPKSKAWNRVYEWSNYRLTCSLINSKKNNVDIALDPFNIGAGLFALEFTELQVVAGAGAHGNTRHQVVATIEALGLNMPECCNARREYVALYENGSIGRQYLERRAPFIAQELRRQGRLLRGDL